MLFRAKLWFLVFLVFISGTVLFFTATLTAQEALLEPYEKMLQSTVRALDAELMKDANSTIQAAAELTADEGVRKHALGAQNPDGSAPPLDAAVSETLLKPAAGRLGKPDFALLLNGEGKIVGRAGQDVVVEKNLAGYPLVVDALRGYMRTGADKYGESIYQMAAAPLYEGGVTPNGVVIVGWATDQAFADALSKQIDAQIALLHSGKTVATTMKNVSPDQLANVNVHNYFGTADLRMPLLVGALINNTERYIAQSTEWVAGDKNVQAIVALDRSQILGVVAGVQWSIAVATLLLTAIIAGVLYSALNSVTRPLETLVEYLGQFAQGKASGVIPESVTVGPFARLGNQLNIILNMPQLAAASKAAQQRPTTSLSSASLPALGNAQTSPSLANMPPINPMGSPNTPANFTTSPLVTPPSTPANTNTPAGNDADPLAAFRIPPTPPKAPSMTPPLPSAAAINPATPAAPSTNETSGFAGNDLSNRLASPSPMPPPSTGGKLSSLFDDKAADPLAAFRVPPSATKSSAAMPTVAAAPNPAPASSVGMPNTPAPMTPASLPTPPAVPPTMPSAVPPTPNPSMLSSAAFGAANMPPPNRTPSAIRDLSPDSGAIPLPGLGALPTSGASTTTPIAPVTAPPAAPAPSVLSPLPPAPPKASEMNAEATVLFKVPQELLQQSTVDAVPLPSNRPPPAPVAPVVAPLSAAAPPAPVPLAPVDNDGDNNRTVVAAIPPELLRAASQPAMPATTNKDGLTAAEETHFREVYSQFLDMRRQCGEETSDLSYEKFYQKLLKNRQQIVEKHSAKAVRFQVYKKDEKAALRAIPVKE